MVRDIKPAVIFFFECRVLPYPGAQRISRSRVEDMGCCMVLGNKIAPPGIYCSMYSLLLCRYPTSSSSFNLVHYHIGLLCNFYNLDIFNLSSIWLLSSTPRVKGSLVQNEILASDHLEHLCVKMAG